MLDACTMVPEAALMFEVNPIINNGDDMVVPTHNASLLSESLSGHGDFYSLLAMGSTAKKHDIAPTHLRAPHSEVAIVGGGAAAEDDSSVNVNSWGLFGEMMSFGEQQMQLADFDDAVLPHTPPRSPGEGEGEACAVPDLHITIPLATSVAVATARTSARQAHRHATRSASLVGKPAPARALSKPMKKGARAGKGKAGRSEYGGTGKVAKALPAGHKPARGRGRHLQLAKMTSAQKKAEAQHRLEKNRQAARDFRLRRKNKVEDLEAQVKVYEERDQAQQKQIMQLQAEVARLQATLA